MKMRKFLGSLFSGILLTLATFILLNHGSQAVAGVLQKWDGNWFWKDGGWIDYAPSGVPDFDQNQNMWGVGPAPTDPNWQWTHSGPVAAANSLWWFDSKFESIPVSPPPLNDNYYLISPYGSWDDHDPQNVGDQGPPGLVDDLAWYFDTDGKRSLSSLVGTEVHNMSHGLQWYLYGNNSPYPTWTSPLNPSRPGSYYDEYHVQLVKKPTWDWVVEEVLRSEDVILLLGFWEEQTGQWKRLGGHYVTVAGINPTELRIAVSDPFFDTAEVRGPGWGRVLSGTLIPHYPPHPGPDPTIHNDAGNVSHDAYDITTTVQSPAGAWEIVDYPYSPGIFKEQNVPTEFIPNQAEYQGGQVYVEVEYALTMSPFYWKAGGEWVHTYHGEEWIWEWWWYEDDGHSCLPDFAWGGEQAEYDGPVAVANSMWWFDSKAETLLTGGFPKPPPTISDHYNLVAAYNPAWDDHAGSNTPLFIDDLATNYLQTDPQGTTPAKMAAGIGNYLAARDVANDFYTKTRVSPSFEQGYQTR